MLNWLLVGYMWLFIHRPFEVWPILATIRLERVYMICVIADWLLGGSEKRPLGNIAIAGVFAYTVAIGSAALCSPYTTIVTNYDWITWLKFLVFAVILLTSVKTEKDFKIIITGITVAGFLVMAHAYREYLLGEVSVNAGVIRLTGISSTFGDTNDYGTTLVILLPMLFPLLLLCKRIWHYLYVLGYILLTLRSVMLTGSRTAFVMLVILGLLPILLSRRRLTAILVLCLLVPATWFAMPESMKNRYRTIWNPEINEEANANFQGRWIGFYHGLENFSNFPITGVGPGMHGVPFGQLSQAHNLPGQVAGETGIFGIVTFLFMFSCFGINHFHNWKNYKFLQDKGLGKEGLYCWRVNIAVMYAITMTLMQGIGLHNAYRFYWVWFGAFQVLSTLLLQEKVDAVLRGTLLPTLPSLPTGKQS